MFMKKSVALALVAEDLGKFPEIARACTAVINRLSYVSSERLQRITFGAIKEASGCEQDQDLLQVVQYLSSARVPIFAPSYYLTDLDFGDIPLDPSVLANARRSGVLYHPETGEEVSAYEHKVCVDFTLSVACGEVVAEWVGEYA